MMSLSHTLKNNKMYALAMAQSFVSRNLNDFYQNTLRRHGLTSIEWYMLGAIDEANERGGIRVTDLAGRFNVKTTYITSVLNGLRTKGYIETRYDANDARVRLAIMTKKGSQELPVIERAVRTETAHLLDGILTPEEFEAYVQAVQKVSHLRQP